MDADLNDIEEVHRLFHDHVPEIADGIVEMKSIARAKGRRTMVAVHSADPEVDPVGACVGSRGIRVKTIVSQLAQEKIDILRWSASAEAFISNALAPAKLKRIVVDPAMTQAAVYTSPEERSLLLERDRGRRVSLCSRLVGREIRVFVL